MIALAESIGWALGWAVAHLEWIVGAFALAVVGAWWWRLRGNEGPEEDDGEQ